MSNVKKLMMTAAGGGGLNVEDVFSTYLYYGNQTARTITNGIDLAGEGGLTWITPRTTAAEMQFIDSERGVGASTPVLISSMTNGSINRSGAVTAYNSDGFDLGTYDATNYSGRDMVSWTFRKAPKFFDVVTWSGNGVDGRTISHNLGSTPGMIIVKRTDSADGWITYHRGMDASSPEDYAMFLNLTNARATETYWNNTAPTSTGFTVSSNVKLNGSSGTYVAYLFAHNDGDGEFGPTGDQDIIKCGSYTGNAAGGGEKLFIDLGFEPQWLMIKRTSVGGDWFMFDNMRNISSGTAGNAELYAQSTAAESESTRKVVLNPTGFTLEQAQTNEGDYIYIAIRRGPMAVPEDADDVFAIDTEGGTGAGVRPTYRSGFPVDMGIYKDVDGFDWQLYSRITGKDQYRVNLTDAASTSQYYFGYNNGYQNGQNVDSTRYSWMWRRAPNYFDIVTYTGDATSGRDIPHNLGVEPEMIWVKKRSSATDSDWAVYHTGMAQSYHYTRLNRSNAFLTDPQAFDSGNHTATTFSVGLNARTNGSNGETYVAFLFASLNGISKVGSYTGATSDVTVDCGFSNGARFVLIKDTGAGNWWVFDTERGIVAGNDPALRINSTTAQDTTFDYIDPHNSGFTVPYGTGINSVNTNGNSYIFYAVA